MPRLWMSGDETRWRYNVLQTCLIPNKPSFKRTVLLMKTFIPFYFRQRSFRLQWFHIQIDI